MLTKKESHGSDRAAAKRIPPCRESASAGPSPARLPQAVVVRRARLDPASLTRRDVVQLQRAVGNAAVTKILSRAARPEPAREDKQPAKKDVNRTGLPDGLKAGVESLSGISLNDVRVHYNSSDPARLHALAYTSGAEIHVGPGQERHLAHEAWHVVQQRQGRVRPTVMIEGSEANDEQALEQEAELLGARALLCGAGAAPPASEGAARADAGAFRAWPQSFSSPAARGTPVQRWSVAAIDEERDRLKTKFGGSAALHHIVSKDTLAEIAKEVGKVSGYSGEKARAWPKTQEAAKAFNTAAFNAWKKTMPNDVHAQTGGKLKETLQNLPFNLEAGPEEPVGDAQTGLDVNTTESTGVSGEKIRAVEPVSAKLAAMNEQWRLYKFHARMADDDEAAAALKRMATNLKQAADLHDEKGMKDPITSQWFTHKAADKTTGLLVDRQSRKGAGTYYGASGGEEKFVAARDNPPAIPTLGAPIVKSANALHRKADGKTRTLPVRVKIEQAAFKHVYERHSYQHFNFEEAKLVNTFFPYGKTVGQIQTAIDALAQSLLDYIIVEISATSWKDLVEKKDGTRTYKSPKVFAIGKFEATIPEPAEEAPLEEDFDPEELANEGYDKLMTELVFNVGTISPQEGDQYTKAELEAIEQEAFPEEAAYTAMRLLLS